MLHRDLRWGKLLILADRCGNFPIPLPYSFQLNLIAVVFGYLDPKGQGSQGHLFLVEGHLDRLTARPCARMWGSSFLNSCSLANTP